MMICRDYSETKITSNFKVQYFVKLGFDEHYPEGSSERKDVERQVETDYVHKLSKYCYEERIESKYCILNLDS